MLSFPKSPQMTFNSFVQKILARYSKWVIIYSKDTRATSLDVIEPLYSWFWTVIFTQELPEKYPNTQFFLIPIFLYSDWIRRFTEKMSVSSPNVGKYGPEKLRIWLHFMQWGLPIILFQSLFHIGNQSLWGIGLSMEAECCTCSEKKHLTKVNNKCRLIHFNL